MNPHAKYWIELDGKIVLGDYRVKLLRLIGETGSLSEAASRLGLSYRRAWGKVRQIEDNLGVTLVDSVAGGAGGGGRSSLTDDARRLVVRYERLQAAMNRHLDREFERIFKA